MTSWRVFSQGDERDAKKRSNEWARHAENFFDTKLVVVFGDERVRAKVGDALRAIEARVRTDDDLRDARLAPGATENGLYDLAARRCNVVWLVERENSRDRVALLVAAIFRERMPRSDPRWP